MNHSPSQFAAKYVKVDDLKAARDRLIGGSVCPLVVACGRLCLVVVTGAMSTFRNNDGGPSIG
jgi:hypothetical protein